SLDPAYCWGRLDATGVVTEGQAIGYCTTTCALGPPPAQSSNPDCMHAALERTDLSLDLAGQLCDRASSAGPVDCFLAGQDLHSVADSTLIQLCYEVRRCQYVGGGGYGVGIVTGSVGGY